MTVCSACAAELGEFAQVAQQTLQHMPQVYSELHQEGMRYFDTLFHIATQIRCLCPEKDENGVVVHTDLCAVGEAIKAVQGFNERILHRPATGKLAELQKDMEKKK